ncbi:hypothetical protein EV385_6675 [Krasilnikovia cinnamomea]|uniref:Uncharacterized protein n=1 Tax=Krasilnikovia cinnamomea TaxID=349313 RepID=A0A4Q7Z804_9ACTN|nr:hypothetical protein [Krasilnikovia cinnamomea]RZU46600.1 hypothetical protein EV385_6675 [Krasilnikovia cinnamomea]
MGIHRRLRGAAGNPSQAVAKLHSLGQRVDELPDIAAFVRRVATTADQTAAAFARRRG